MGSVHLPHQRSPRTRSDHRRTRPCTREGHTARHGCHMAETPDTQAAPWVSLASCAVCTNQPQVSVLSSLRYLNSVSPQRVLSAQRVSACSRTYHSPPPIRSSTCAAKALCSSISKLNVAGHPIPPGTHSAQHSCSLQPGAGSRQRLQAACWLRYPPSLPIPVALTHTRTHAPAWRTKASVLAVSSLPSRYSSQGLSCSGSYGGSGGDGSHCKPMVDG